MINRLRPFVAPGYLLLCLVLGGSGQGVWGNAVLRLLAVLIIAWALIGRRDHPLPAALKQLLWLAGLAVALAIIQLIPLPISIWASLPGREQFVNGFQLLGIDPGPLPLSLDRYDTLAALLALLPGLGMIAAMVGLRGYSSTWLAAALIGGTAAGVLLGILQVASPAGLNSPWYLYRVSNFGVATGFFANSNHMASLLLVTIPFLAALGVTARNKTTDVRLRSAALAVVGGGLVVVILGLFLNGSLAGYGLALPVVLASLMMLFGFRAAIARGGVVVIAIGSLAAIALLWSTPVSRDAATSTSSRQEILARGVGLVQEFGMVGSGVGTFEKTYRLAEDADTVDRYYVNHAHNDYLELAIETGLPGILLLLLFLAWWGASVSQMTKSPAADQFAYAGAIASAALLLHSAVDYPLRTAAMDTVFAMCLVLIIEGRRTAQSDSDLRPVRHLVVG